MSPSMFICSFPIVVCLRSYGDVDSFCKRMLSSSIICIKSCVHSIVNGCGAVRRRCGRNVNVSWSHLLISSSSVCSIKTSLLAACMSSSISVCMCVFDAEQYTIIKHNSIYLFFFLCCLYYTFDDIICVCFRSHLPDTYTVPLRIDAINVIPRGPHQHFARFSPWECSSAVLSAMVFVTSPSPVSTIWIVPFFRRNTVPCVALVSTVPRISDKYVCVCTIPMGNR